MQKGHKTCACSIYILIAFLIIGVSLLVGITAMPSFANATDNTPIGYAVTIEPAMAITVSSEAVNLSLNPISNRPFGSGSLNVTVTTNNKPGYELYMSADTTDLIHTTDSTESIATLPDNGDTGYTEATFVDNKWGYKIGNANYFPFASEDMIDSYDDMTNGRTANLGFAAKVDASKPAGTYSNTFTFSAVPKIHTIDMQNLDPSLCTSTPTAVSDLRDANVYTVARLADGQCWMVSNLNLAGGTKLYSETSDVPSGYPRSGETGYFTLPASSTDGFSDNSVAYVYNSGNTTTDQADCTDSQPCNSYYSWMAATAGGKDASGSAVTSDGGKTAYSVCPKGWRLPSATTDGVGRDSNGYTNGDFYKMLVAYGMDGNSYYANSSTSPTGATMYSAISGGTLPNFLLAGFYYDDSLRDGGSNGYYWSSSSYSSTTAYLLDFYTSYVFSANSDSRKLGYPVRCILREGPSIDDIETMQDFGALDTATKAEVIASMDSTQAYPLKDERDNKYYNIAKLADGQVWMTTSLNLAGGTALYSETSDVPAGYPESGGTGYFTLPTSSSFSNDSTAYVYNAPNKNNPDPSNPTTCTPANGSPCDSYYSWLTATAGGKDANGSAVTNDGYNAAYSICPKGWRLPTATTSNASPRTSPNWKTSDNYKLATAYGANLESNYYDNSSATGANFYNNAGPGTLPNFLLAGYYQNGSLQDGGSGGNYWLSSSNSSEFAYRLTFNSSTVDSAGNSRRRFGYSVRCVLGES